MALVFNMGSQARLAESIDDADTRILLTSYDTMLDKGGSGDIFYARMVNAEGGIEIVLVDVGNSDAVRGLSVTRGVESTSARNWGAGTIIWQVLSEASWGMVEQSSVARQVAFIPDGVLTSDYIGEKVYQTDLHLWWKAVGAAVTEWRLIAGEIFTADVVFSPGGGIYALGTALTMTCATSGASIYYTTDATDPDETDTLYTAPVTLLVDTAFKARAFGVERWQNPSINITSGDYLITLPTAWADKSMTVNDPARMIYSDSDNVLLHVSETKLYQRVGFAWSQVLADVPGSGSNISEHIIEDGVDIWMVADRTNRAILCFTNTATYPAWIIPVDEDNTAFAGSISLFRHVVKFGSDIYLDSFSSNTSVFKHGLYKVNGVDDISLYSKYSTSDSDVTKVSAPVEFNGSLYAIVISGDSGWLNNLLRLDSGTAVRITTDTQHLRGLFVYNSQLYAWGQKAVPNGASILRWNGGSSWITVKEESSSSLFWADSLPVQVGNIFHNYTNSDGHLWRWDPATDTLAQVASNLTTGTLDGQNIAWDLLDSPASMWLIVPDGILEKTYRWE